MLMAQSYKMERLHQMHVVPDVIGNLHPTVDMRLVATGPITSEAALAGKYVKPLTIEPGIFLKPRQVIIILCQARANAEPANDRLLKHLVYTQLFSTKKLDSIPCSWWTLV